MLTPVASPTRTLPRRSPHIHPKTPQEDTLKQPKQQEKPQSPLQRQLTPRRPRLHNNTRRTTTQWLATCCARGGIAMRLLMLFLMSLGCILLFSQTLLPDTEIYYSFVHEEPLEMQQGLPTSPSVLLNETETNADEVRIVPKRTASNSTTDAAAWPRVVLLEEPVLEAPTRSRKVMRMRSSYYQSVSKKPRYVLKHRRPFLNECKAMNKWQKRFYPTCNSLHEFDLGSEDEETINNNNYSNGTLSIQLLSDRGSWRMAWKVVEEERNKTVALKMLHTYREFDDESYGHAMVDAIAMERLTKSKHTIKSFGFCGQSVITEWAPGTAKDVIKHPKLDTLHRLMLARDLALGLADVHSIGRSSRGATFAHNDINVANMVQGSDGKLKYNDFNIGVMMRWNATSQRPCGFPVDFTSPLWRAPEEIRNTTYVSEKVDIYSLGNVIFHVLTKHQPWTWLEPNGRPTLTEVGMRKAKGDLPYLPEKYRNNTRLEIQALQCAYKACFSYDPEKRPSAAELSEALTQVLKWKKQKKKVEQWQIHKLFGLDYRDVIN